jgi:DNA mismatch repair protein MutS2
MPFVPGDLVHVASIGKGTVREVRNGERYLVEVKGRSIITSVDQLTAQEPPRKAPRAKTSQAPQEYESAALPAASLDLHGHTVAEAVDAVTAFLNIALLSGSAEVRIIHGRSGGKIKASLHALLKRMSVVRSFAVDPQNPGMTIVRL